MLIDEMKKEFGQMKFDVVIGNPPYNKDIYLDFVTLGHTLASKYDCWITQQSGKPREGQKNEGLPKEYSSIYEQNHLLPRSNGYF